MEWNLSFNFILHFRYSSNILRIVLKTSSHFISQNSIGSEVLEPIVLQNKSDEDEELVAIELRNNSGVIALQF